MTTLYDHSFLPEPRTIRWLLLLALLLFTLAACVPPPGPEAFYKRGEQSYQRGDFASAFADLRRIAATGHPGGQFLLAQMYANGEGVAQDLQHAGAWYQKAADGGVAEAQYTLGVMFQFGSSGPIDRARAMQWYLKSADQGYTPAQLNLADMLKQPNTPQYDLIGAYKWYSLVLRFDLGASRKIALLERRKLDKIMSDQDIETGQRLAREWNFPPR